MIPPRSTPHITITTVHGQTVYGKVVHITRIVDGSAEVHITTTEWLDPYRYEAIYSTGDQAVVGYYVVFGHQIADKHHWLFKGTFKRVKIH